MRRIIILVTLTLTSLICANGQPAPPGSSAQKGRGRVMVKRLPAKVEGVILKDGEVKLKPGYKFVKRTNGMVAVARISGSVGLSNNLSGTWGCQCSDILEPSKESRGGDCGVFFDPTRLRCTQGSCKGSCTLAATVDGVRTNIIMY